MANHASSKKRVRRTERRTAINKSRVSRMRTFLVKVEEAIAAGKQKPAQEALKAAQPELQRNAAKGLIHKKTASRTMSRLSARVKALK